MPEEILRKSAEDFPIGDQSEDFLRLLSEQYDICVKASEDERKEAARLWENYENTTIRDRYGLAANQVKDEKLEIFRSAIAATKAWILTCIILDAKPKIYLNPVFATRAGDFLSTMQNDPEAQWIFEGIEKRGFESFWNEILDRIVEEWWSRSRIYGKLQILIQRAVIQGRAWSKIRIEDDEILFENVPHGDIVSDPWAETKRERRFLFHIKSMRIRDAELLFDLKRGDIKAEMGLSGLREEYAAPGAAQNVPDEIKFKLPQCRVIEAWIKDKSRDEGGDYIFPKGRIVTFIKGQDAPIGIKIVSDRPAAFDFWQIQDYIPKPISETRGIPISRNGEPVDRLYERVVQQAAANLQMAGNAYISYKLGMEGEKIDALENVPGQKVPFGESEGFQIIPPPPVTAAAQSFLGFLTVVIEDIFSVHDVTSGRRPGGVESGKGIMALQSSDVRAARPYIEALYDYLTPISKVFGQMILSVADEGFKVRYGEGYRSQRIMPFALNRIIEDVESYVTQDSEIPRDTMSLFNLLSGFADRLPLSVLLRFLPIEIDRELILSETDELERAKQMIQQLQQQLQALGAEHQKMGGEMQAAMESLQEMKTREAGDIIKGEMGLQKQREQVPVTLQREQMRQRGNLERVLLQGAMKGNQGRKPG